MRRMAILTVCLVLTSGWAFGAADVKVSGGVNVSVGSDLNLSFFYESLAPHGEWRHIEKVGWAWQPSVVVIEETWRPYANGHWVWSDYGWYWVSDYEWGWAPFHYGRWTYVNEFRWVWVPDVTWGPAWVVFREGGGFYGWAPLPPGVTVDFGVGLTFRNQRVGIGFDFGLAPVAFTFVAADRFLEPNLATVAVRINEQPRIFERTKVVQNSITINDNRVINQGVPVQQVAQATKKEIKPLQVTEAKAATGSTPREQISGNQITAFKPQIKNEAPKDPSAFSNVKKADASAKSGAQTPPGRTQAGTADQQQQPPNADQTTARKKAEADKPEEQKKAEVDKPEEQKKAGAATEAQKKAEADQAAAQKRKEAGKAKPDESKRPDERGEARRSERQPIDTSADRTRGPEARRGEARSRVEEPKRTLETRPDANRSRSDEAPRSSRGEERQRADEMQKPGSNAPSSDRSQSQRPDSSGDRADEPRSDMKKSGEQGKAKGARGKASEKQSTPATSDKDKDKKEHDAR